VIITDPLISADYGGWWRRTLALIARIWPQLLALQACAAAVTLLFEVMDQRPDAPFWMGLGAMALDVVVSTAVTLVVVRFVVFTAVDRPPALRDCLRGAAPALLPLIGWTILCIPLVVLGILLFVLPGVFVILAITFLAPVVAVERGQEIRRCFDLVNRSWAKAGARAGTIVLITVVAGYLGAELTSGGGVRGLVLAGLAVAAAGVLAGPLTVTAYADLRALGEPVTAASIAEQLQNR
jgi:hypothetical protein